MLDCDLHGLRSLTSFLHFSQIFVVITLVSFTGNRHRLFVDDLPCVLLILLDSLGLAPYPWHLRLKDSPRIDFSFSAFYACLPSSLDTTRVLSCRPVLRIYVCWKASNCSHGLGQQRLMKCLDFYPSFSSTWPHGT